MPTSHRITVLILTAWLGILPGAGSAIAGGNEPPDGDPAKGRAIAEKLCAGCHAVTVKGASPVSAAPAFRSLREKWPLENLSEALAEGIVTGHPGMPAFELSPAQIDDFMAWLRAIQTD